MTPRYTGRPWHRKAAPGSVGAGERQSAFWDHESDLHRWLEAAGFKKIEISVVAREEQPPHFETVLASGQR